jgi:hypothetical protein
MHAHNSPSGTNRYDPSRLLWLKLGAPAAFERLRTQHKLRLRSWANAPGDSAEAAESGLVVSAGYSLVVRCALESLNAPVKKSLTKLEYTEFSGYNLVASVPRKEKHVAAVVSYWAETRWLGATPG